MALVDAFEWLKDSRHVITDADDRIVSLSTLEEYNVKEVLVDVDPDKDDFYEIGDFVIRLPEEREDVIGLLLDLGQEPYKEVNRDKDDPELIQVHLW